MKKRFLEVLDQEVLLADGAMGTLLHSLGVPLNARDEQNITNPNLIRKIHEDYINAGARIIETNTFSANRIKLRSYGLLDKIEEINRAAVRIAKEAAGNRDDVFIAGSVGPLGVLVKPYGNLTIEDLGEIYAEQIRFLVEEGVDLIIIETHPSLLETQEALNAAKSVCDLPIITSMTFLPDGRTTFGDELAVSLEALASAGADVVGINCTIGPQETYDLIEGFISKTDLRVLVMPNAGYPTMVSGRTVFLSPPEYLKKYAKLYVESGASIVGGCCGTTPEHIRAMADVVRGQRPRRKKIYAVAVRQPAPVEAEGRLHIAKFEPRFSAKLGKEFVITVEIDPPKGLDYSRMAEGARMLKEAGIDAVTISESPMARVRMSPIALAHLIQEEVGIETVLHFTCRDHNIVTIQADLLGAAALGIQNILVPTGDPSSVGDFPKASSIFDVSATGLVRIIKGLNQGFDLSGTDLGRPTRFRIGVAVNPMAEDMDRELAKFAEKISAGADFAQTQPLYDVRAIENFVEEVRRRNFDIPIIIGILPLRSLRHAEFLNNEVPGIAIPDGILRRLRAMPDKEAQAAEGIQIARELIRQAQTIASGVNIMPPFEKYDMVLEILQGLTRSESSVFA